MKSTTPQSAQPLAGAARLSREEVMKITGHRDRSSFWQWVARSGLPMIRLSPRKIVFEAAEVYAWLDSRRVGKGHQP